MAVERERELTSSLAGCERGCCSLSYAVLGRRRRRRSGLFFEPPRLCSNFFFFASLPLREKGHSRLASLSPSIYLSSFPELSPANSCSQQRGGKEQREKTGGNARALLFLSFFLHRSLAGFFFPLLRRRRLQAALSQRKRKKLRVFFSPSKKREPRFSLLSAFSAAAVAAAAFDFCFFGERLLSRTRHTARGVAKTERPRLIFFLRRGKPSGISLV